jgi:cytochrome c biogenesis protein CcdA
MVINLGSLYVADSGKDNDMCKKYLFNFIMFIAFIGVAMVLLTTYVFEFFVDDQYIPILMVVGFLLIIISLVLMGLYNKKFK